MLSLKEAIIYLIEPAMIAQALIMGSIFGLGFFFTGYMAQKIMEMFK
jgi:hypothetical protein